MDLGNQGLRFHRLGKWVCAAFILPKDACFEVICQELQAERIQGGSNSRDLVQHIDTTPFLFDHALHTGDLTCDMFHSPTNFFPDLILHWQSTYTRHGYLQTRRMPSLSSPFAIWREIPAVGVCRWFCPRRA